MYIKRYKNRNLYDRVHSRYTNLNEVISQIRSGGTVEVTQHEGSDCTNHVLKEAVAKLKIPNEELVDLIRRFESE